MNTKNLIATVLLVIILSVVVSLATNKRQSSVFQTSNGCCSLVVYKVDDTVSYVVYRNNKDYDGYEEYQLNDRLDNILEYTEDFCIAHHSDH